MLWKKKIGEGRVHCSRVMVLDRRRLEVSGWKTKELSIGRWTELVRQNVQLVEIRCVIAVFDIFFVSIIHTDLPSFLSFLFFCICVWTWISAADKVKLKLDSTLRTVNASCFLKCMCRSDYSKIQIDAEWVDCAITPKLVFLCLLLSWCFTSRETITLIRDRDCPDELYVIAWRLTEDNQIFAKPLTPGDQVLPGQLSTVTYTSLVTCGPRRWQFRYIRSSAFWRREFWFEFILS